MVRNVFGFEDAIALPKHCDDHFPQLYFKFDFFEK